MKNIYIVSILLLLFFSLHSDLKSQSNLMWTQCYGGSQDDKSYYIKETSDGGTISAGYTTSLAFSGSTINNHGGKDAFVLKLNAAGTVQWQQSLGGTNDELANVVKEIPAGGYIIAGSSGSGNGNVGVNFGGKDAWIVKLSPSGSIVWSKVIGGLNNEEATSVFPTSDGGFFVVGYSFSSVLSQQGGATMPSNHHGNSDIWTARLDGAGNVLWTKCFGGSMSDRANATIQHSNGTYYIAGYTESNNGDVSGNHQDQNFFPPQNTQDYWVINVDPDGNLLWQKCLGGSLSENANDLVETMNGEIVVAGYSYSSDGDVPTNAGMKDAWLVKLSASGTLVSGNSIGGMFDDLPMSVNLLPNGGYLISGSTNSGMINGTLMPVIGYYDYFMMYLDNNLTYMAHAVVGGTGWDYARSVVRTVDGNYVVGGYTNSSNGFFTSNSGSFDFGVVKINASILPVELVSFEAKPYNNDVYLEWQTATEVNNAFFIVERSENGTDFEGIGLIEGHGTSYVTHDYQFTDHNVAEGKWYYRLHQVDIEGTDHYSDTRIVTINHFRNTGIYPNPAVDNIIIAGEGPIKSVTISDFAGRSYLSEYYGHFSSTETMNVSSLPKGTYILMTLFEDGQSTFTRLIKE